MVVAIRMVGRARTTALGRRGALRIIRLCAAQRVTKDGVQNPQRKASDMLDCLIPNAPGLYHVHF